MAGRLTKIWLTCRRAWPSQTDFFNLTSQLSCLQWDRSRVSCLPPVFFFFSLLFSLQAAVGRVGRQCIMQFGWLKENIKALPYWIWQHVQSWILLGHSLLLAGRERITSSSFTAPPTPCSRSSPGQTLAKRTPVRTEICLDILHPATHPPTP